MLAGKKLHGQTFTAEEFENMMNKSVGQYESMFSGTELDKQLDAMFEEKIASGMSVD